MNRDNLHKTCRLTLRCLLVVGLIAFTTTSVVANNSVADFASDISLMEEASSSELLAAEAEAEATAFMPTPRIIGGQDALDGSWPSLVVLVGNSIGTLKNRIFCGATVVADRWVMTAAHCLYRASGRLLRPSDVRVVAGVINLDTDVPTEETIVTNLYVHPQYNQTIVYSPYDVALLELGSAIDAPAVSLFAGDVDAYVGETSFIAGWGATRFVSVNDATYPSQLQDAPVPIVSREICNSNVSYQGLISPQQMCAGYVDGGVDACVGDSGGPLFIIENGITEQVGITSYGNGCGLPNFYGIYTSVSNMLSWMGDYIEVPYQSPELIALLQSGITVTTPEPVVNTPTESSDSDDRPWYLGSTQSVWLLVLALSVVARRRHYAKTGAGSK